MDFAEVVRRRRMVRRYLPHPVEAAAVNRIVDAARRGPSAGFSQGQAFVVVTDAGDRKRVAAACGEPAYLAAGFDAWVSSAPVLIVLCAVPSDYHQRYARADKASSDSYAWRVPWWWVDAGAALSLLLLAAVDEGLAAGFLDIADTGALRALLDIPDDVEPMGVVTIGHGAPDRGSASVRQGRRPRGQIVHQGRWA